MKSIVYLAALIILFLSPALSSKEKQIKKEEVIDKKVKELLSQMTLEEKVGQMTQVTIETVAKQHGTATQHFEYDINKMKDAIVKYHVGSILNVYDVALSVDYWHKLITEIQNIATKETRLKIPILYGIDAIHGANYTTGATLFPQAINMAATFNSDLVKKEGEITALEVRASGIPWNFYPVLDLGRQQLWPRLWETYGEDVYLDLKMGESYIEGAQGNDIGDKDKVAVCLKHYVGYSFPIDGKDRTPAWISERMMQEYFLPPFEKAVEYGAQTVMVNSSEVDGIPGHSNYHLLTEVLRGQMKFKGIVVSDWQDIERLYTRDKVADSPEDAVRMAVMAGVDMSMVPLDFSFYNYLLKLVKKGKVPEKRIDEAVSRILRVKLMLGLFENPYPDENLKSQFASKESDETNLQASEESIVLAKNEGNILPLSKNAKVLVTGPTANMLSVLNSGWTITWQGNEESLYPKDKPTILKAIQQKINSENVKYVPGTNFNSEINIDEAVNAAKDVDDIILCLGEHAYCETPGNINDLTLDTAQLKLAHALIKTGKPVILVMIEGRPRVINSIADEAKGILLAFLPGMNGGEAISNILFGDANPSARLSVTYPRYPDDLVHYDYKPLEASEGNQFNPQWSFGYGLSYTTFSYSNLKLDKNEIKKGDKIKITVDVKNTGTRKGKDAILLYLNDEYASVSRPVKQLKRFTKVELNPGETRTVEFTLNDYDLSFIGRENKRIVEPGKFKIFIGDLSSEFTLLK
ncbi:MAG: glycoside hydrolase family 3 C-terminal domain-containing protein [Bacteroidetes bacterium]|nr:glycoside hydrolase family 3 C-terminal domain-containing protein [Bacteroidota bacterium]